MSVYDLDLLSLERVILPEHGVRFEGPVEPTSDLDGDGVRDLAVAFARTGLGDNRFESGLSVFSTATGERLSESVLAKCEADDSGRRIYDAATVADRNGDGVPDIAVAARCGDDESIHAFVCDPMAGSTLCSYDISTGGVPPLAARLVGLCADVWGGDVLAAFVPGGVPNGLRVISSDGEVTLAAGRSSSFDPAEHQVIGFIAPASGGSACSETVAVVAIPLDLSSQGAGWGALAVELRPDYLCEVLIDL